MGKRTDNDPILFQIFITVFLEYMHFCRKWELNQSCSIAMWIISKIMGRNRQISSPFIAFSPYYDSMRRDLENINHVLEISPESIIIAGGFEASLNPQWGKTWGFN